jgi:hypothetical protein
MEKYRLVQEHKVEGSETEGFAATDASGFPEVRITQQGKPRNYISYAMSLFVSFRKSRCNSLLRVIGRLAMRTSNST